MPKEISSATRLTKSERAAVLAMSSPFGGRGGFVPPRHGCAYWLLVLRGWRLLEMLLHHLLVFGHHVGHFGLLVRGEQLVDLGSNLGVLNLHLDVRLRFLSGQGGSFSLIESTA